MPHSWFFLVSTNHSALVCGLPSLTVSRWEGRSPTSRAPRIWHAHWCVYTIIYIHICSNPQQDRYQRYQLSRDVRIGFDFSAFLVGCYNWKSSIAIWISMINPVALDEVWDLFSELLWNRFQEEYGKKESKLVGLEHVFPYIGNVIIPTDELIFLEG